LLCDATSFTAAAVRQTSAHFVSHEDAMVHALASTITDGLVGMIRCMPTQLSDDRASAVRIGLIYDYYLPLRAVLGSWS